MKSIIAENAKAIIKERGLKQSFVGEKAGYSEQAFSNLLNGRKTITDVDILNIAVALGVTPNELFSITSGGEEDEKDESA